jgi:pyruvate kinase
VCRCPSFIFLFLSMTLRRTRIVATLGPATDPPAVLRGILDAGVDVARINFSHGSADEHLGRIAALRAAAQAMKRPIAVLGDLPGPKLRVRLNAERQLAVGESVIFGLQAPSAASAELTITEPAALRAVKPGQRILLDDGRLQLEAMGIDGDRLRARVTVGGTLLANKGVNLPDTPLTIPALSDRDREAIAIAARAGVDWLALSFIRSPSAAEELRSTARQSGLDVPILAKIERPEAVEQADAIIAAFDGIMVARGDLGVEIPLERVPTVQKRLIAQARQAGKPVITATDMLDSMRLNPRPTRAEAGDVANAIYDGTDAVMLSGETAVGAFPVEAVACMHRIAIEAEANLGVVDQFVPLARPIDSSIDDRITHAVVELAGAIGAEAIVTPTLSGRTARLIARHRPLIDIVAPVPSAAILRRMAIVWGVRTVLMDAGIHAGDDRLAAALKAAFEAGAVESGQRVVILAGHPVEGGPRLPAIRFVRVGAGGSPTEP